MRHSPGIARKGGGTTVAVHELHSKRRTWPFKQLTPVFFKKRGRLMEKLVNIFGGFVVEKTWNTVLRHSG
jgi:hypothetical protein